MATKLVNGPPAVSRGQRFGRPQVIASGLLFAFLGQGLWLARRVPLSPLELGYINSGPGAASSPVIVLVAHQAGRLFGVSAAAPGWPVRIPFLMVGVLLGASLWYIARRLHGNAAGYLALSLYSFSPTMITYAAHVGPETFAAWAVFGGVFTAIAVAHTLYAPREVILWNWQRILLLGAAIGVGAGAQVSTVMAVPIGLAFMWYLAPERRPAALAILAASCGIAAGVFWASHGFSCSAVFSDIRSAGFSEVSFGAFSSRAVWRILGVLLLRNGPGFILLLLTSAVTFVGWPYTRFFGTLAPLLVTVVLVCFALVFPYAAGFSFLVIGLPFLFVFVAGVFADLFQSRWGSFAFGIVLACLVMNAYFSFNGLLQVQ